MTNLVFRERTLINSMLSMAPNIVFAPNIRRTQNTDTGRKTQTQLIIGFAVYTVLKKHECIPVGCVSPALYRTRGRGSLSRVVSVQRESLFGDRLCLGVGVSLSQGSLSRGV